MSGRSGWGFRQFGEFALERTGLFEPLRHVAHQRGHADHPAVAAQRHDGELDRDRSATFPQCRYCKQIGIKNYATGTASNRARLRLGLVRSAIVY